MARQPREKCMAFLRPRFMPRALFRPAWRARYALATAIHAGDRVECPCCGGRFRGFRPFGRPTRATARCPRCDALERHRLVALRLAATGALNQRARGGSPLRVLHFAPEASLDAWLAKAPGVDRTTVDLSGDAMARADLERLPFRDGAFDIVLCSHVLEHVQDDAAAMRELARVLAPEGLALVLVPLDLSRPTLEDPSVTSWAERERLFGQGDHVRWYGHDLQDRLMRAGLRATARRPSELFAPEVVQRHGLWDGDVLWECRAAD